MIKARPKSPTDLYGTFYIDNIQKAVVICLIIPTIFPFDAISCIKNTRMYDVRCPASKGNVVGMQIYISKHEYCIHLHGIFKCLQFINTSYLNSLNTKRGNDIRVGNPGTSVGQAQMSCGVCRLVESQPSPLDMCC